MKSKKSCKYFDTCGSAENCARCAGYEKLIAAAPDMLAALENSLTDTDDDHARGVVQNAINKAKGGE